MMQAERNFVPDANCPPFDPNPKKPQLKLPPRSCDSHFHVFGPGTIFPYANERKFTPHDAPKEALFKLHRFLGFERGVFVQSSCHGFDHTALLDALAAGAGNYRGVALLEPTVTKAEVARLDAAGVRGVRFHFMSHLGKPTALEGMRNIVRLIAPFGWHVAMHFGGNGAIELFDFMSSIEAPVVIDHIGRVDVSAGPNGKAFAALRRLIDRGTVWVKLSGVDRISKQPPPFGDAVALARNLADHAPERVLWGTDWPHPNIESYMPNDGELVDLIAEIAVDETTRRRMLVDNPAELFGFGRQGGG